MNFEPRMDTNEHECSPEQPEGLPEISRGLSAATPPVAFGITMHPEGVPESFATGRTSFCDPFRVVFVFRVSPGVSSRFALLNPRLISGTASRCAWRRQRLGSRAHLG